MTARTTLLATVLTLTAGPAWAAPTPQSVSQPPPAASGQALSLEDAFNISLNRAETVQLQAENIKQAELRYDAAKSAILPSVSGAASYTIQQPSGNAQTKSFAPDEEPLAKITATQPLFRGLREFAALRQNTALINASKLDRDAAVVQLYKDVAAAFYNVTAAERDLANIRIEMAAYDKRIKELQKFNRIGRSQISDVLTAQSAQATLKAQEKVAKGTVVTNREILAVLTGLPPETKLVYGPTLPTEETDVEMGLKQVEQRPEIVAADERVRSAEEGIDIARGARLPSVDLNGNYYLVRAGISKDVRWDVALGLTVPIYDGGLITSQVDTAVSQKRAGLDTKEAARRAAIQEIRTLKAAINTDREQITDLAAAAELARKTYEAEEKDYRLGLVTNLDVLQALTAAQENQRALDKVKFQLMSDYERYQAAIGLRPKGFALSVKPRGPVEASAAGTPAGAGQAAPAAAPAAPPPSEF